jgi:hypothetical protein
VGNSYSGGHSFIVPETQIGMAVERREGQQQLADGDYARPRETEHILIHREGTLIGGF